MSVEPNKVKEMLIEARALILDEKHWIKGSFEKNGCYCAMGAVREACLLIEETPSISMMAQAIRALSKQLPCAPYDSSIIPTNVAYFNDCSETKHQDILDLYTRAIESLQ